MRELSTTWAAALLFAGLAAAGPTAAQEQEAGSRLETGGSLRGGLWSRSRSLDGERGIPTGSFWGTADWRAREGLSAHADAWLRAEGRDADGSYRHAQVREAYVRAAWSSWELSAGRQIIAWGKADGINPTDNLIRRDYTLLTPLDTDQRVGVDGLRLRWRGDPVEVTAFWSPRFQSSRIPLPPVPGARYEAREPPWRDQFALRVESAGGAVDWSVSYFDGAEAIPDLSLARLDATGATVALTNHRVRVLGADASTAAGPYALRAELGWARPETPKDSPFAAKREQVLLVLGGDRNITSSLNLNLQYFAQRVRGFESPREIADPVLRAVAVRQAATANQTSAFQHGLTLRLSGRWFNDALEADTSLVWSLTNRSRVWRTKGSYAIDDHWRVTAGFDLFRGPQNTFLGQLRRNSAAFAELRRDF